MNSINKKILVSLCWFLPAAAQAEFYIISDSPPPSQAREMNELFTLGTGVGVVHKMELVLADGTKVPFEVPVQPIPAGQNLAVYTRPLDIQQCGPNYNWCKINYLSSYVPRGNPIPDDPAGLMVGQSLRANSNGVFDKIRWNWSKIDLGAAFPYNACTFKYTGVHSNGSTTTQTVTITMNSPVGYQDSSTFSVPLVGAYLHPNSLHCF